MSIPSATLAIIFLHMAVVVSALIPSGTFMLERAFNHTLDVSRLAEIDAVRFRQKSSRFDFPVAGHYDPYIVGFYYTKVRLGYPAKEYYLLIDTGSDVLWVGCSPCDSCPTSSGLQIPLELYDPSSSSTASLISCLDPRCSLANQSSHSYCSSNNRCGYTIGYGDGSNTSGYYVSDLIHLDTLGVASNSSAFVVFGCNTFEAGHIADSEKVVNGIIGFGPRGLSVIAQLSSREIAPAAFAHCLAGSDNGGGFLVIGYTTEPNMVYTPLVPSRSNYNIELLSISVNGQALTIDPSIFAISQNNRGTIIDSGTSLTYLPEGALYLFVDAITQSVLQSVQPLASMGHQCYLINSSISKIFPMVSFNFAGGAMMVLRPQDYLLQQGGGDMWCIGFRTNQDLRVRVTILGDLVLKDKLVVYDLGRQRIGWTNYNCHSSVNVSSTSSADRTGKSSSLWVTSCKLLLILILAASCSFG